MGALGERREGSKAALGPSPSSLSTCLIPAPISKGPSKLSAPDWRFTGGISLPEILKSPKQAPFGAPGLSLALMFTLGNSDYFSCCGGEGEAPGAPRKGPHLHSAHTTKGSLGWRKAALGIKSKY